MDPYATSHFSNDALRHDLRTRSAHDCKSTAILLSRVGEFDERRLYLEDGYSSMHAYCVQELHWCEGTASWRIYAARAARRFPVLYDAVADGRLHLTAVVMLRKYLTSGNVDDLVAAATHKSRAEIERLIADRFPQPDLPERLAAIPPPVATAGAPGGPYWPANTGPDALPASLPPLGPAQSYWPANTGGGSSAPPAGPASQFWPANAQAGIGPPAPASDRAYWPANAQPGITPPAPTSDRAYWPANAQPGITPPAPASDHAYWPANTAAPAPQAKVKPLAPERFGLQVTLDQEAYDLLQEARALRSHKNPGGEIAQVIKDALRDHVANLRKRKFAATARPRNGSPSYAKASENGDAVTRHIPAEVKRAVCERDQGRCTFVSESGKRCGTRTLLEFDHVEPVARGGQSTMDNVRLRCRAHNQWAAERAFGVEFMEQKRGAARGTAHRKRQAVPCRRE